MKKAASKGECFFALAPRDKTDFMASGVAKNTLYLVFASVAQKLFSFVYFTLIARLLGAEQTGVYITALSFSSLFVIFTDLGLTSVLIREGAKEKEKLSQMLSAVLLNKIILAAGAYGFLNLLVYSTGYAANIRELVFLTGAIMVLDSISLSFYGVLRALQNLRFEALGIVISQMITVAIGLFVLWQKGSLLFLVAALAVGSFFNAAYAVVSLKRHYRFKLFLGFPARLIKMFWRMAWPFALAGIFTKIYSYADMLLLSRLLDARAAGWYSVPYKITFAFQFIPLAFSAALYPAMSKFFVQDKERLKGFFEKGMIYLALIGLPIAFGIGILAETVVVKIYGSSYLPAVLPLKILLVSLIFGFLDFPVGALLNACNRQMIQTAAMGLTMIMNLAANLILIPRLGVTGAAIAALLGNFCLLFFGCLFVSRVIPRPAATFWLKLLKATAAAALMGTVVLILQSPLKVFVPPAGLIQTLVYFGLLIVGGGLFYLILLFVFRLVTATELKDIWNMFMRKSKNQETEIVV